MEQGARLSRVPGFRVDGAHFLRLLAETKCLVSELGAKRNSSRKWRSRAVLLGCELNSLGGFPLMLFMVEAHVPKGGGAPACFDAAFDGIGEWAC